MDINPYFFACVLITMVLHVHSARSSIVYMCFINIMAFNNLYYSMMDFKAPDLIRIGIGTCIW